LTIPLTFSGPAQIIEHFIQEYRKRRYSGYQMIYDGEPEAEELPFSILLANRSFLICLSTFLAVGVPCFGAVKFSFFFSLLVSRLLSYIISSFFICFAGRFVAWLFHCCNTVICASSCISSFHYYNSKNGKAQKCDIND
jgi:hypothetical protein